ncbi:hypothetical protein ABZP36_029830 [Zizania latifolia]
MWPAVPVVPEEANKPQPQIPNRNGQTTKSPNHGKENPNRGSSETKRECKTSEISGICSDKVPTVLSSVAAPSYSSADGAEAASTATAGAPTSRRSCQRMELAREDDTRPELLMAAGTWREATRGHDGDAQGNGSDRRSVTYAK